jgi:hypothetical protein
MKWLLKSKNLIGKYYGDCTRLRWNGSANGYHDCYLKVFALIRDRDRTIADLFDDLRRSNALISLANIKREGLLTAVEFAEFSPEARQAVEVIESFRRE